MPRTLDELMEESKQYIYKEPEKPREHWENDEWFFKAISIVIMEPVLIKSAQIICNWFPPMKLLFKTTIKKYMVQCSKQTQLNNTQQHQHI
tara:strand:- start:48 stop:320 length:273 start_codon:yes stop_codon:yes gene_type:complete